MKPRRLVTPGLILKRIAEGRGQGDGADYIPWLKVQDFPSRGRVHRLKGWKHGRVHHLFSDLERNVFFCFQWPRSVLDFREQFPLLPIDETIEIAKDIGVRHPADPRTKSPIVMTTDSLLTVKHQLGSTFHPRTVKYAKDLQNMRVREKLEIERRYWLVPPRHLVLKILTEQMVSNEFVKNMLWLHPYYWLTALDPINHEEVNRIASVLTRVILNEDLTLSGIAQKCDRLLRIEAGTCLAVIRHLIANRHWEVDVTTRIRTDQRLTLFWLNVKIGPSNESVKMKWSCLRKRL